MNAINGEAIKRRSQSSGSVHPLQVAMQREKQRPKVIAIQVSAVTKWWHLRGRKTMQANRPWLKVLSAKQRRGFEKRYRDLFAIRSQRYLKCLSIASFFMNKIRFINYINSLLKMTITVQTLYCIEFQIILSD